MTTTKKLDIDTLTETAQMALRFMVQEPRAFLVVLKEAPSRWHHHKSALSQAHIVTRSGGQFYSNDYKRSINKASLAAMPGKGLMVEIERPETYKPYSNAGDLIKFYRLSDMGKAAGEELLSYLGDAMSLRERSKQAVTQAEYSIKSAERKVEEAQARLRDAQEAYSSAVIALGALGDETVLTPDQQVLYDLCLAPTSRSGDVLIEGTHNNAVLRRLAETQKDVLHITDAQSLHHARQDKRPILLLIEDIDALRDMGEHHRNDILRDGGRIIATANDLELARFHKGMDEPMVIEEKGN